MWAASVLLAAATLLPIAALLDAGFGTGGATTDSSPVRRLVVFLSGRGTNSGDLRSILLLVSATVLWILHRFSGHLAENSAHEVARRIGDRVRRALFRQHLRIGPGDVDGRTTASVYQRTTSDIETLAAATIDTLSRTSRDTMMAIACLALACLVDPLLALQCLLLPAAVLAWLVVRDRATWWRATATLNWQISRSPNHCPMFNWPAVTESKTSPAIVLTPTRSGAANRLPVTTDDTRGDVRSGRD